MNTFIIIALLFSITGCSTKTINQESKISGVNDMDNSFKYFEKNRSEFYRRVVTTKETVFETNDAGNIIRIGRMDSEKKYLIEGLFKPYGEIFINKYASDEIIKIMKVGVTSIIHEAGNDTFSALPLDVYNRDKGHLVVIIFPRLSDDMLNNYPTQYHEQIFEHEINHIRTNHIAKMSDKTLDSFRSELLTDLLYFKELPDKEDIPLLLDIKRQDINGILSNPDTPTYYRKYLTIIKTLIDKHQIPALFLKSDELIELLIRNKDNWLSVDKIEEELLKHI